VQNMWWCNNWEGDDRKSIIAGDIAQSVPQALLSKSLLLAPSKIKKSLWVWGWGGRRNGKGELEDKRVGSGGGPSNDFQFSNSHHWYVGQW
jgi:hypothetical protein